MAKQDPFKTYYDPSILIATYREIRDLIDSETNPSIGTNVGRRLLTCEAPSNALEIAAYREFSGILDSLVKSGMLKPVLDDRPLVLAESFNRQGRSALLQKAIDEIKPVIAGTQEGEAYMRLRALDTIGHLLDAFKMKSAQANKWSADKATEVFASLDGIVATRKELVKTQYPRLKPRDQDFNIA